MLGMTLKDSIELIFIYFHISDSVEKLLAIRECRALIVFISLLFTWIDFHL